MQGLKWLVRGGSFVIDVLLVMAPVQLITLDFLHMTPMQAQIFFVILFALYGALLTSTFHGVTVGKYFGKLVVVGTDATQQTLVYLGLRELVKGMYFLPLVGPIMVVGSFILYVVRRQTLHDWVGHTQVVTKRKAQMLREQEG